MTTTREPNKTDHVLLLHGLAAHRICMSGLAWRLHRAGFQVSNLGYRSIRRPIETHVRWLIERLQDLDAQPTVSRVHVVAHSMGSIITRAAAESYRSEKFQRLVMLGPPNRGSHVARRLAPYLGWLCPPLAQLSDDESSFVRKLPNQSGLQIGVIAAAGDRKVPISSTHVAGQRDWILLPGEHGALPWRRETLRQVCSFLRDGVFLPTEAKRKGHPASDHRHFTAT